VASINALRATIEGDFARALKLLDEAATLAERAEDNGALLTIPMQRMMILQHWNSPEAPDLEEISAAVDEALQIFPEVEMYVRPLFATYMDQESISALLVNEALIERIVSGGDRFTIMRLTELAIGAEKTLIVERTYESLLPFRNHCGTLGLMGSGWYAPVAETLGLAARALNDFDSAHEHLLLALEICKNMHANPGAARVQQHLADLSRLRGDDAAAVRWEDLARELIDRFELNPLQSTTASENDTRPQPDERSGGFHMKRDGDVWQIEHGGRSAIIRNSRGLEMLSRLIGSPDQELHVLDIANPDATGVIDRGDAGPGLDEHARRSYQKRISDLEEELEEAETLGDTLRADRAREEIEFIGRELSQAFGIGGRARTASSAAERARVNVQRRLSDAITRIEAQLPQAGRYLKSTIKTGSYCAYRPL
jgi:tetratricopeptide (TPR) repeat protein